MFSIRTYVYLLQYPYELFLKIRHFLDKFAEQLKTHILCSVTFPVTGTVRVIRNFVQFSTDRQTIDSNVRRRMVIPYSIIMSTGTNSVNIQFKSIFSQEL